MKVVVAWSKDGQECGIVSTDERVDRDINLITALTDPDFVYITSIQRAYYNDIYILHKWQKEFEEEVMWEFHSIDAHELDQLCKKTYADLYDEYEKQHKDETELTWEEIMDAIAHARKVMARELLDRILDEIPDNLSEPESMLFTLKDLIVEELKNRLPF